nr:MAG TPA: hypothetical protein [Caudoviricetes sp.]
MSIRTNTLRAIIFLLKNTRKRCRKTQGFKS